MPCSEAQIRANQQNAQRSTGPKTLEGKQRSRANSLQHGLTGAGVVMPEADAAEVERRAAVFATELNADGETGQILAWRAALSSVRMERAADQQTASLVLRVCQAEADFVPPEGCDDAEADRLRAEAARRAMFDPSKEATLARQYEAAAERSYFRCLKELRQREQSARVVAKAQSEAEATHQARQRMASILEAKTMGRTGDDEFAEMYARLNIPLPKRPLRKAQTIHLDGQVDLPIADRRRP